MRQQKIRTVGQSNIQSDGEEEAKTERCSERMRHRRTDITC